MNRSKMWTALLTVILLLLASSWQSKTLAQSNSLTVPELQQAIKLIEGEIPSNRAVIRDMQEQLKQYSMAVIDYQTMLDLSKEKEATYQKMVAGWQKAVDELTPSWLETLWQDYIKPGLFFLAWYGIGSKL